MNSSVFANLDSAQNVSILDEIIVFMPQLSFFGGLTSLSAEDIGLTVDVPKDVVALGSKAIVNTELLNVFKTTRSQIQRRAKLKGTQFLGGFAMSKDEAKEFISDVTPVLDVLKQQVEDFLVAYPSHVTEWANAHPLWSEKILAAAPSLQTVKSRFSIKMPFIKIAPPSADLGENGVLEEVTGITGQILSEIASDVRITWSDRGYGAQKIKPLLRRISDKAKALSFINSDLAFICKTVDELIVSFPVTGKIEGEQYLKLKGFLDTLLDPVEMMKSMKNHSLAIVIDDSLDDLTIEAEHPIDAETVVDTSENLDFFAEAPGSIEVADVDFDDESTITIDAPASISATQDSSWAW